MPRVYVRRFDYDEARSLRASGKSYSEIAALVGVSVARVRQVLIPEEGRRAAIRSREYGHSGSCIDCGAQVWQFGKKERRCVPCARVAAATTVRDETLLCVTCREWKPDHAFPFNRSVSPLRRDRHSSCRSCLTEAKRDWRARNKVPCIECGAPTDGKNRPNPGLPIRCHACATKATHAQKRPTA